MKSSLTKLVFTFALVVCPQVATSANACTCLPLPSPSEAFQKARAVFIGKTISSKDIPFQEELGDKTYPEYERHFRFVVAESLKGLSKSEVDISAGPGEGDPIEVTVGRSNEPLKVVIPFPKLAEP